MRKITLLASVTLLLPLAGRPAFGADPYPTQARGFATSNTFQTTGIDNVNLFNGNLVITIPLGQSYPLGGGLSYGLTLVYNSHLWDFREEESFGQVYTRADPVRRSNAGLGWRLSLGELSSIADPLSECLGCYTGPDGADHRLDVRLHYDVPSDGVASYTTDGTYLRQRWTGSVHEMDFPDGQIHVLSPSSGLLTQIRDRFGNYVNVAHGANSWALNDMHGRSHTVNFASGVAHYGKAVSSVVLSTFGGGSATYTFNYTNVSLPRPCPDDDPQTGNITVPLLTSITLPDGSFYSMPSTSHHLDGSTNCRFPGLVKDIRLPTQG